MDLRLRALFVGSILAAGACSSAADGGDGGRVEDDPVDPGAGTTPPQRDASLPPVVQFDSATPADDAGTALDGAEGTGGDAGTGDAGTPTGCASPNACAGATAMGSVSGDTGAETARQTGSTSKWLKLRVREDDSAVTSGKKLKLTLTLTSPAGSNFDLRVYLPLDPTSEKCTGADRVTSASTGPDVAALEWGEGTFPNGADDSRTVTIEVLHVSGTCDPSKTWSLLAEGNR
jgi:hypothetical protein